MAPESSQAVVLPKFDMHVYTSILSSKEFKEAITKYCIPVDLHPHLPPPDLTMNKLPPKYIGLYIEQLEQGGLRVPFSTFFLAVIKHFGVHVSQGIGFRSRIRLVVVRRSALRRSLSLKGWKKKFFLIDLRAILDAMPWRHTDTDLRDDFPTHYNENDAARLAEFVVPLRPPPRHMLYGDPIPQDQRPKIRTTPPLAVGEPIPKNLEKPNSKIVAAREKKDHQTWRSCQVTSQ
ncbi:hypothetical protein Tco_1070231 [Tanacetum coccineum]|uniref:Uncharacterized protein n=1 Tax=Tanacetum coccineum TaxID=301880 RepID=A0ABQ5HM61_9ASTR